MCIICKQARRVGRTWGGMSGMAGGPKWQAPMLTAGRRGQPVPRFGKRAFLHALPHLVCGPLQHKVGRCCCDCVQYPLFGKPSLVYVTAVLQLLTHGHHMMLSQQHGIFCTVYICCRHSELAAQQAMLVSMQGEACLQQQTTPDGQLSLHRRSLLAYKQSLHNAVIHRSFD